VSALEHWSIPESENARLKKLLAESMLENEMTRETLRRKF
jgi:putative transposase